MSAELSLLLIEDNPADSRLIRELLRDAGDGDGVFHLENAASLQAGLARLADGDVDVVLTDLNLPDSAQLDTFLALKSGAPHVPIVILTTLTDDAFALDAVRRGAQDYLVKGEVDGPELIDALRFAIERHQAQHQLQRLAHVDELTGLYNRRGFREAAEQHDRLCGRTGDGYLLFFVDVDGLKAVNDAAGHAAGDRVLARVAAALRNTFRTSDILARWGGDEFVAIATHVAKHDADRITTRLLDHINRNDEHDRPAHPPSISVGFAYRSAEQTQNLDELIAQADRAMYQGRRRGRNGEPS